MRSFSLAPATAADFHRHAVITDILDTLFNLKVNCDDGTTITWLELIQSNRTIPLTMVDLVTSALLNYRIGGAR